MGVPDTASDTDDDSLCTVEDDKEDEDIEIDDNISVSSEESGVLDDDDDDDDDDALANSFDSSLTDKVMSIWNRRRSKLAHDYSLAGWLLSPNPTIMADAKANTTSAETDAVKRLLFKIVLSPTLVGEAREMEKARLSQEFWDAHMQFQNRDGNYNKAFIWYNAAADDCKPYEWHLQYSRPTSLSHGPLQWQLGYQQSHHSG